MGKEPTKILSVLQHSHMSQLCGLGSSWQHELAIFVASGWLKRRYHVISPSRQRWTTPAPATVASICASGLYHMQDESLLRSAEMAKGGRPGSLRVDPIISAALLLIGRWSGWWFGFFPYIGNNHPNWRAYFSEGLQPPTSDSFSWNLLARSRKHVCFWMGPLIKPKLGRVVIPGVLWGKVNLEISDGHCDQLYQWTYCTTQIIVFAIKRPIFWGLGMLSHSHVMLLKPIGGQWPCYVWMAALESVACACCMRTHAFRLLRDFFGSFFRSQSSLCH